MGWVGCGRGLSSGTAAAAGAAPRGCGNAWDSPGGSVPVGGQGGEKSISGVPRDLQPLPKSPPIPKYTQSLANIPPYSPPRTPSPTQTHQESPLQTQPCLPPPYDAPSCPQDPQPLIPQRCKTPLVPPSPITPPPPYTHTHLPNLPPSTHGAPSSPSAPQGGREVAVPAAGGLPRRWQAMGRGPGGAQRGRGGLPHLFLCVLAPVPAPASAAVAAAPVKKEELGGPQPCWGTRGVNGGLQGAIEMQGRGGGGGLLGVLLVCLLAFLSFHLWGSGWLFRL